MAIDEALEELSKASPRQAEVVKLRYFTGLTVAECAAVLEVSPRTVNQDWVFARAWLHRKLGDSVITTNAITTNAPHGNDN